MLFHILAHVDADHRVLAAEHRLGEGFAELRLAHARRAEEEERPNGPLRVLDADAPAADGARHGAHRVLLPEDACVERRFERQQPRAFALVEPCHRNARPVRHHGGDVLRRHARGGLFRLARLLFPLGCRLRAEALFRVAQPHRFFVVLRTDGRLLVPCGGARLLLECFQFGRGAARLHAHARRRLIDKVDGLVGQKAVGQIPLREPHRRAQGLVLDGKAVMRLVLWPQALQNLQRLLFVRLADLHALKAPFERGVLFDELSILLERRRADDADLPASERGL